MTHVSKKKLSEQTFEEIKNTFLLVLTEINNKQAMSEFLDVFLSTTEKEMLAKRLAIIYLLDNGIPETNIAQLLHVTQSTVSLMKLKYENNQPGFQWAISQIKKQKLLQNIEILALRFAKYAVRASGGRI
ncbi:MAG: helix-turn-helix domain-containing protein [Candidatus Gottesmanbacteria bacterium]